MADQVGGSARRTGDKARRLLELMNVLLGATTPVPVASIRSQVADYPPDDASFRRAFERDKVELRAMGVPLLVETIHDTDPPGIGYRIKLADWSLRDPGLDAEELEALRLASAAVGAEGGLGSRALYKLGCWLRRPGRDPGEWTGGRGVPRCARTAGAALSLPRSRP